MNDFIAEYNGKLGIGDTPQNDGQCVGLVEVWLDRIGSPHIWGNACDMPANADRNAYVVTPNSDTFVPQVGDVVCYPAGWGGSAVGHTALVAPGTDVNHLVVFEQNDRIGGGNGECRLHTFDYSGNPTFIHPKVLDNQKEADMPTLVDQNALIVLYAAYFFRQPDDGAKVYLNQPLRDVMDALAGSPERQAIITAWQSIPKLHAQIADLQTQVSDLNATLKNTPVNQPAPLDSASMKELVDALLKKIFHG